MTDEGRWLRPQRRQAWRGVILIILIWCWPMGIGMALFNHYYPPRLGGTTPGSALFQWGIFTPALIVGWRMAYWSAHRSLAWYVDPEGIAIWRRGAVAHRYAWSEIRGLSPRVFDSVGIQTADAWREHSIRIVPFEDVQWFREYASSRVVEQTDGTEAHN